MPLVAMMARAAEVAKLAEVVADVFTPVAVREPRVIRTCEFLTGDRPRDFVRCEGERVPGRSWCRAHCFTVFTNYRDPVLETVLEDAA